MKEIDSDTYDAEPPLTDRERHAFQVIGGFMARAGTTQTKFLPNELRGTMPKLRKDEFGSSIVEREPNRSGS